MYACMYVLFAISSSSLLWHLTHALIRQRSLFDLHYSFPRLPLLLVLMLLVDLLRSQVSVRVCIRVIRTS